MNEAVKSGNDALPKLEARYAYYRRCQTLKKNGEQCRAPAVRGEQICCKHSLQREMQARWRRQREGLGLPERFVDRRSVLKALTVVGQALMEDRIDEKLAGRLMWELGLNASALLRGAFTAEARRRGEKRRSGHPHTGIAEDRNTRGAAEGMEQSDHRGIGTSDDRNTRRAVPESGSAAALPIEPLSTEELLMMTREDIEAFVMSSLQQVRMRSGADADATGAEGSVQPVFGQEASKQGGTQNNLVRHPSR